MSQSEKKTKSTPSVPRKARAPRQAAAPMTAPQKLKLLITIVNRDKADFYMDLLQSFEVNMQLCALGHGTAGSELLHVMGLEDNGKAVIFSMIREDRAHEALETLADRFATIKNGKGIAFAVPLSSVIGVNLYQFLSNNKQGMEELP